MTLNSKLQTSRYWHSRDINHKYVHKLLKKKLWNKKSKLSKSHFSEHRHYYQSLLCVSSLHGINPDVLCIKWENRHLSVPLVGTLILEMIQVSVQLHQLSVCYTTLVASRPLGCTGPIFYNVLASKNTQTAHSPRSRGLHLGLPEFRKAQSCLIL